MKKLIIMAMFAAGAMLSKPAFAMEASNSSKTEQYSNVDLTKNETYSTYIESIKQLENDFSKIQEDLSMCDLPSQYSQKLYLKWFDLIEKENIFSSHLEDRIPNLKATLDNAHNCKSINNPNYKEYAKKFFNLFNSLTDEYNSIDQGVKQLETDIITFVETNNIPGAFFIPFSEYTNKNNDNDTSPATE